MLIDATDPWGFGHLFPRGLLREPPAVCGGPGVVLITRADKLRPVERCDDMRSASGAFAGRRSSRRGTSRCLIDGGGNVRRSTLRGQPVAAFAGSATRGFRQTLEDSGAERVGVPRLSGPPPLYAEKTSKIWRLGGAAAERTAFRHHPEGSGEVGMTSWADGRSGRCDPALRFVDGQAGVGRATFGKLI